MPGQPTEGRGDRVENERMGAPRAADDDEFRVGQGHHGGENPADGLAQRLAGGLRLRLAAADRGQQAAGVNRRRGGSPEA